MECYEEKDENDPNIIKNVTCLYKLAPGICPQSHGFACAKKADIKDFIINEGKHYANEMYRVTNILTEIDKIFV